MKEKNAVPDSGPPKSIVSNRTEFPPDLPIGRKYFQAVDLMTENVGLKDGKYYDILVYAPGDSQPSVKILRIVSNYEDGTIGKQDEIKLASRKKRLQFNAECDTRGKYVKYPTEFSENTSSYLEEVIELFESLIKKDGSHIWINNGLRLTSKNGVWVKADNKQTEVIKKKVVPKLKGE